MEQAFLFLGLGPMFSGKTTHAITEATKQYDFGNTVLYINHSDDVRSTEGGDSSSFTSHNSSLDKLSRKIDRASTSTLIDITLEYNCYFIDEGQFFGDLYNGVLRLLQEGKKVYVYSLDGDFRMKPFGDALSLIPLADVKKFFTAKCSLCGYSRDAPFTKRLSDETDVKVIGSADKYEARCRLHYFEN